MNGMMLPDNTCPTISNWVSNPPYVHADQHNTIWYAAGTESRLIVASDDGLFYSSDGGAKWSDRNKNLAIKQFFSCATRPELGSNYFLAGAQDNGVHQLKKGKSYSFEVTGGDGGFVDISQSNPNIQFGSYVYNLYRRSTDGGKTWSKVEFSSSTGQFINPFDYDEQTNALFACYGTDALLRWNSASSGSTSTTLTVAGLGNSSAVTVSPYTLGTIYAGSTSGKVFKVTNANTSTLTAVNISDAAFPSGGVVNCITLGSDENTLAVIFSNYGINNIWYTADGGTSWSQIDGNLPNMPVRWAVFPPGVNDRLIIATEAGVYTSGSINGSSTFWTPSFGFPTVRTNMLKVRPKDNAIIAATHGRGLWTANIAQVLPLRNLVLKGQMDNNGDALLSWTVTGTVPETRFHLQFGLDGINFRELSALSSPIRAFIHNTPLSAGYYRLVAEEPGNAPLLSNTVHLTNSNKKELSVTIAPNPIRSSATVFINGIENDAYQWEVVNITGRVMQSGSALPPNNTTAIIPLHVASLPSGMYWFKVVQSKKLTSSSFIKM